MLFFTRLVFCVCFIVCSYLLFLLPAFAFCNACDSHPLNIYVEKRTIFHKYVAVSRKPCQIDKVKLLQTIVRKSYSTTVFGNDHKKFASLLWYLCDVIVT